MAFTRANPFGWFKTDTLTSAQANQMDTNISNSVDKRTGQTDTVSSGLTVDATGSLTFASGSALTIANPASVSIAAGDLEVDCSILGATYPLRMGLADENVLSTSHTVTAAAYTKYIIALRGALTGATNVILPTLSGYSKLIHNFCSGAFTLTVKTAAGTGVLIPAGKTALVYCDGVDIIHGPIKESNVIESIQWNAETAATYGDVIQAVVGAAYTDVTGYMFIFTNIKDGDIFDIIYTGGLTNSDGGGITYLQIVNSQDPFNQLETIFPNTGTTQGTATISTQYTSTSDEASFVIGLMTKVDNVANPGSVVAPLSLTVKQIRP